MSVRRRLWSVLVVSGWVLWLGGCGGSGGGGGVAPPSGGDQAPPQLDGAAVWADRSCGICHGADGSGDLGPDLSCYSADGLFAYVRLETTPHVVGPLAMTNEEAAALEAFLGAGLCGSHVPASHTLPMGAAGILHRAGLETPGISCAPCHGPDLQGYGTVPSCTSCHGAGTGSTGCTGCHASPQDNGDGIPLGGRRAVTGEFALASHHGPVAPTDADCRVCHDTSAHRLGAVRLFDVDDSSTVIVLTGDPAIDAGEAVKLEPFCLACHDTDAAGGGAPFSDGVMPIAVDETAWSASKHAAASLTCSGDGTTFGCHSASHGTSWDNLLHEEYVVADPHQRSNGDYQACWACHDQSTILSGSNAFDEFHSKHVVGEDAACAVCHDVHGAYDSSERGLISFARSFDEGWMTLLSGTTLSSAFVANSGGGTCTLRCHGENHVSEGYTGR